MDDEIDVSERLEPALVRQLVRQALEHGVVGFTKHGRAAMRERNVIMTEVTSCLRRGRVEEGQFEEGAWRYCLVDDFLTVVVEFESPMAAILVTLWKIDE